jgi:hypothetical protein
MDLSKYPIQKLVHVVASIIPGFAVLLIYCVASPHAFDWFFFIGSLGYRTKIGITLLVALLIGITVTRGVAGMVGAIEGGFGAVLSKPPHMVKVAPWRDVTWRAALAKVVRELPKNTILWPDWLYQQKIKEITLLPEDQRLVATRQLEIDRLASQAEDADWNRWYRHYHSMILFPTEKDFLVELQRGIHFNLQSAAVYVLFRLALSLASVFGGAWFQHASGSRCWL